MELPDAEPAHVAVTLGAPWPLSRAPSALPPGHEVIHASSFALSLFLALSLCLVPTAVLAAIELSRAYLLLFLGQVVIAIGALEWSWLAFRIRRKLLFMLSIGEDLHDAQQGSTGVANTAEQGQDTGEIADQEQEEEQAGDDTLVTMLLTRRRREMRASQCAVSKFADRYCGGRWFIVAFGVAVCGAGVALAAVYLMEKDVFYGSKSLLGRRMLVSMTVGGLFLSLFLGCLAPTKLDVFVLALYMSCFIASTMNTFLMYYSNSIGSSELLDPLFVLLVGACTVFLLRVVSSKFVMESLFAVMGDILGLIVIVSPMLLAADFVSHPGAERNRAKLALFFLVVFASEVGRWVTKVLKTRASLWTLMRLCRRHPRDDIVVVDHALKNEATASSQIEELLGAIVLGTLMLPFALVGRHNASIGVTEAVLLIVAMALGQWSRFLMASVKQMAEVTTTGFYLPADSSVGGVLDRTAVFLVAMAVYHPYIKHAIYS